MIIFKKLKVHLRGKSKAWSLNQREVSC